MDPNLQRMIESQKAALAKLEQMAAATSSTSATAPVAAPPPMPAQTLQGSIGMQILTALARKALTPEDQAYLQKHIAEGAPGIVPFLDSETLVSLFQIGFPEYKRFLAGEAK